jgi:hypothetical protein
VYSGKNVSRNFLPPLYFYPEDGNKLLLRNIDKHLSDRTVAFLFTEHVVRSGLWLACEEKFGKK